MSDTAFLVPGPGLLVRDPLTREPLPPAGESKPLTAYWRRRLHDGDVVKGAPSARAAPPALPTKPAPAPIAPVQE